MVRAKIQEIFMPMLSSTMTEGKIVSWSAGEGDRVSKDDDVIVNIETFTVPSGLAPIAASGEGGELGSPWQPLKEVRAR
jgi:pyruvate dehydrogenase E2 component (dihydrolipoamide acetyltransferase)